jgi:hypothetical protein
VQTAPSLERRTCSGLGHREVLSAMQRPSRRRQGQRARSCHPRTAGRARPRKKHLPFGGRKAGWRYRLQTRLGVPAGARPCSRATTGKDRESSYNAKRPARRSRTRKGPNTPSSSLKIFTGKQNRATPRIAF